MTKPLERPRATGGVRPGVPPACGSSAGAVESPESGTGRRWLGKSRESMLSSRVVVDGRALVAGVDHRLATLSRALEAVADRGGGDRLVQALGPTTTRAGTRSTPTPSVIAA